MAGSTSFLNVGNGLIEIAALTALIGSATAESLTLGNKGAAGLAWAAMSTFGALSVVKACAAGATPGWLRETLGVRNDATDSAIGLSLDLNSGYRNREDMPRKNLGEAVGVTCERQRPSTNKKASPTDGHVSHWRDTYAFDQFTMNPVLNVSPCEPGEPLKVHIFPRDPWYTGPVVRGDWAGLIGSLVKLIEIYFLWRCNARTLCWVRSCSWFYFFTTAAILLHQKLSREYGKDFDNGQLDIVTGQLPTARKRGGERIALLGAPRNFRHHMLWRIVWIIGSAVCASSLVVCYVLLGRADITVTYVWVGFQILWLILRSIFFHLAQGTNTIVCPILVEKQFEHLQGNLKNRALDLVFALSKCQMHGHPRGMYAYEEDLRSFEQMKTFLSRTGPNMQPTYPMDLLRRSGSEFEVFLVSVVGDTLLTSAAWFQGSKLTGMDLYDSCIVTLRVGETHFSIPAARALCASPLYLDLANVEGGELSLNSPKGVPNPGPELVQWYYWVPCSDGR